MNVKNGLLGIIGAGILASASNANADRLKFTLDNLSGGGSPVSVIQHKAGASEGPDGFDSPNLTESLDIYSKSYTDLAWNALPTNSLTTVTNFIDNNSISPVNFKLRTTITLENGEFNGKVLNVDLYNISNGIPIFQGTYNATNLMGANALSLTINQGHGYNVVFRPTNPPIAPPIASNTVSVGDKVIPRSGSFNVSNGATNVCVIDNLPDLIVNGTNFTYNPQGVSTNHNLQFYAMGNGGLSTTNTLQLVDTNRPPVAFNVTNSVNAGSSIPITLQGYDPDYPVDTLTYSVNTNTLKGTLENVVGNNVVYHANNNEFGNETISYSVSDGEITNNAQINLTVNPVNRQPSYTEITKLNENTLSLNSKVQPNRYVEFLKNDDLSNTNWQVIQAIMVPNSTDDYVGLGFNDYNATNSKSFYNLRQRLAP